jgi:hypothetical protein
VNFLENPWKNLKTRGIKGWRREEGGRKGCGALPWLQLSGSRFLILVSRLKL